MTELALSCLRLPSPLPCLQGCWLSRSPGRPPHPSAPIPAQRPPPVGGRVGELLKTPAAARTSPRSLTGYWPLSSPDRILGHPHTRPCSPCSPRPGVTFKEEPGPRVRGKGAAHADKTHPEKAVGEAATRRASWRWHCLAGGEGLEQRGNSICTGRKGIWGRGDADAGPQRTGLSCRGRGTTAGWGVGPAAPGAGAPACLPAPAPGSSCGHGVSVQGPSRERQAALHLLPPIFFVTCDTEVVLI